MIYANFTGGAELSHSASRSVTAWLHADLTDTHGMPRRSGGMHSARLSSDHADSLSQPGQRSQVPGYAQRSMSDNHRCIVGFEAPSSLPHPSPQQHSFSAASRTSNTSSVLAAVSDHLQRLDPTRPNRAPAASSEGPSTMQPLQAPPPAPGSGLAVRDPTDYGSVVQQARPLAMHECHAPFIPYNHPRPSPRHPQVAHGMFADNAWSRMHPAHA